MIAPGGTCSAWIMLANDELRPVPAAGQPGNWSGEAICLAPCPAVEVGLLNTRLWITRLWDTGLTDIGFEDQATGESLGTRSGS
jgi:hypothetical protein